MQDNVTVSANPVKRRHAPQFVILSLIGVFVFFVPLRVGGETTVPIEWFVSYLTGHFMPIGRVYALLVILMACVVPFVRRTWNKSATSVFFTLSKLFGAAVAVLVFLGTAPEAVMRADHGPFLFESLGVQVGVLIPIGAIFLTFLMDYGFIDFVGCLLQPVMRVVWKTPGRSAV